MTAPLLTLEQLWTVFEMTAVQSETSDEKRESMKLWFFSGAGQMVGSLIHLKNLPEIRAALSDFGKQIDAYYGSDKAG